MPRPIFKQTATAASTGLGSGSAAALHEGLWFSPRNDQRGTTVDKPAVGSLLDTVEKLRGQIKFLVLEHDHEIASLHTAGVLQQSSSIGMLARGASAAAVSVPLVAGSSAGPTCCVPAQTIDLHLPVTPPLSVRSRPDLRAVGADSDKGFQFAHDCLVELPASDSPHSARFSLQPTRLPHAADSPASCADEEPQHEPAVSRRAFVFSDLCRTPESLQLTQSSSSIVSALSRTRESLQRVWEILELWQSKSHQLSQEIEEAMGQKLIGKVVQSKFFEPFFAVVILLSCAIMGFEAQILVRGEPHITSFLESSENVLNVLFTLELAARIHVFGWRKYVPSSSENAWNLADASLVVVTSVIFGLFLSLARVFSFKPEPGNDIIRVLAVLRAFRLMRLIRVVQRVEMFHEAWLLLQGLAESGRTLLWTVVVIFFMTYVFAVFGMVLIAKKLQNRLDVSMLAGQEFSEQEVADFLGFQEYFLSLDSVMMTLVQLLTLDSWNALVRPLIRYVPWCWCYFYTYIAVGVFVLMNLVTAIIVENALTSSKNNEMLKLKEKDAQARQETAKLNKLFISMDKDGDGMLSWEEFQDSFTDPKTADKWRLLDFRPEEGLELFKLLDTGDGEIDTEEFFDGLRRMKGVAQSRDVFRLQKAVDRLEALVVSRMLVDDEALVVPRCTSPSSPSPYGSRRQRTG